MVTVHDKKQYYQQPEKPTEKIDKNSSCGCFLLPKHGDDELGTDRGALKFAATSSAGMWMQQFSSGGVDRFALALPGFLQVATTRQQWRAWRNVEDRWNKSVAWGTYRWPRSNEDDRAG